MSLIDEVKKSIQEDLTGIKAAADLMHDQQPDIKENIKDTKSSANLDINIDKILEEAPTDEKGNKIIDDNIFDKYYKQMPAKVVNQSHSWRTTGNGGKLIILGGDPERDKDIHRQGANASNTTQAQRRSLADDLRIALSRKATRQTLEALDLTDGATNQDAITAAAILQATEGNVKALQYIRDTIGEQPTAKQDLNVSMTDDDKRLLEKVEKRLNG